MYVSRATTERRNFLFREIIIFRWVFIKIIFEVCRNFCISFVVFVAAVYRPSSSMVDYRDFEDLKILREFDSFVNVSPLHHRPTTEREKKFFNNNNNNNKI